MALHFFDEEIQQKFKKLSFIRAECKKCGQIIKHTSSKRFHEHMKNHKFIYAREEHRVKTKVDLKLWKHIRTQSEETDFQCVLCKECIWFLNIKTYLTYHTHAEDDDPYAAVGRYYEEKEWEWKYCKMQETDSEITCYDCNKPISIDFCKNDLTNHLKVCNIQLNFQEEEIRDKFEKLSFTEAQCKICSHRLIHTNTEKFRTHIQMHESVIDNERQLDSSWKYIRSNRTGSGYQCVLCKENVDIEHREHISTIHNHEDDEYTLMGNMYDKWEWKYREVKQEDDSKVKCYICGSEISIDFFKDVLMNHIRRECLQATNPMVPDFQNKKILQNFSLQNIWSTTAKCKSCNNIVPHTCINNFSDHICERHKDIVEFETKIVRKKSSWKYIKLRRDQYYECVLCRNKIVNDNDIESRHTHKENNYILRRKSYDQWEWKYCKGRNTNRTVICDCGANIKISLYLDSLKKHIEECEQLKSLKNMQSEEIELLWKHFKRSSFETVKCKTCDEEFKYIEIKHFRIHIEFKHKHIVLFEEKTPFNKSCRNLQSVTSSLYECTICQQKISSKDIDTLVNHECKEDNNTVIFGENMLWKYSERITDFKLKCAVCRSISSSPFLKELMSHIDVQCSKRNQETCDVERQTGALSIKDIVWQYFEKTSNSKATCRRCHPQSNRLYFKYAYIEYTSFPKHLEEQHSEIFQFETEKQSDTSWKYLKYFSGTTVICVLCNESSTSQKRENHIHDNDFPLNALNYEDWQWKYCVLFDSQDPFVRCDICREKINIKYDITDMLKHLRVEHSITVLKRRNADNDDIAGYEAETSGTPPKQLKRDLPR